MSLPPPPPAATPPVDHPTVPTRTGGAQSTPLVRAIESGDPDLVSRVLAELTPAERKQELAAECAGSGGGDRQHDSSSTSTSSVMLPVFHAASAGNVDVFLKVLGALKASLSENAVGVGSPGVCVAASGCCRDVELA